MSILPDLSTMSHEDIIAHAMRLQAQNAKLMASNANRKLTLKVSKNGGVSLYGFGKWPVTLYKTQWAKVIDHAAEISAFIEANDALLSQGKDDPNFPREE